MSVQRVREILRRALDRSMRHIDGKEHPEYEYITYPTEALEMTRNSEPDVEIACEVRAETEKAIQIFDGKSTVWIPRSQITDECEEDGKITSIFVKHWLALEKGLI